MLLEMNRQIGKVLGVQLAVDALKLSPANPSFLDMRDAILLALDNKLVAGQLSGDEHASARRGIWTALAHFGMGPKAGSNGASLSGIVADFNLPPDLQPGEPGPTVEVSVEAKLAIPDNQAAGVTSTLKVQQAGKISRLAVAVDIEHTYIGDLQVSLISPGERTVILHNRSGASADNISKVYSSDDTPALAALLGEQVQGDWRLKVADLARLDVGTLRRWGLEIELEASPKTVQGEAAPGLAIPDNDPTGISSAIAIDQPGLAEEVSLSLDITHTYIGDLRVELIAPAGQQVMLHNRSGGSRDNLITTYDPASTPALAALKGQSIRGNWVLRVTDLAGRDVGKLNRWSLTLTLS
jgi:subtilisin-like proprotein convertase family protein